MSFPGLSQSVLNLAFYFLWPPMCLGCPELYILFPFAPALPQGNRGKATSMLATVSTICLGSLFRPRQEAKWGWLRAPECVWGFRSQHLLYQQRTDQDKCGRSWQRQSILRWAWMRVRQTRLFSQGSTFIECAQIKHDHKRPPKFIGRENEFSLFSGHIVKISKFILALFPPASLFAGKWRKETKILWPISGVVGSQISLRSLPRASSEKSI